MPSHLPGYPPWPQGSSSLLGSDRLGDKCAPVRIQVLARAHSFLPAPWGLWPAKDSRPLHSRILAFSWEFECCDRHALRSLALRTLTVFAAPRRMTPVEGLAFPELNPESDPLASPGMTRHSIRPLRSTSSRPREITLWGGRDVSLRLGQRPSRAFAVV